MPTLPGGAEWLIILFIILLLFGGRKLPELTRSVGQSIKEFRKASNEDETRGNAGSEDDDPTTSNRRDAGS